MSRVLIANRGEIAVRILRAARAQGIGTVAVYAADDRDTPVVARADETHALAGDAGYLDAEQLVDLAVRTGCDLLHPGYGFLSESPELAERCAKSGVTFVGPDPDTLGLLGDKVRARALAASLDVPLLPATSAGGGVDEAAALLARPGTGAVMVKAVAGGGGRGMRVVADPADLAAAWERAASEARRSFGRGDLYAEEHLPRARHVEVQVVGDGTGAAVHLHDRDCSVQRRHQKLVEIAPAVTLAPAQRAPLHAAAVRVAEAVGLRGLATVEFLVDADDPSRWFFLEVNPRLQVEHTVTEEVTGLDLVGIQLRIAGGATLADLRLGQDEVPAPRGVAVQARVNLERVTPDGVAHATAGPIAAFQAPTGPGVRVDTYAAPGLVTTGRYDSLLAKVVVHVPGSDLAPAAAAAYDALGELVVEGPATNRGMLRAILAHPTFTTGAATTGFVDAHLEELVPDDEVGGDGPAGLDGLDGPAGGDGVVRAPFLGTVVDVPAEPGAAVAAGAPLVVLEAMKMEHVIEAPVSGVLDEVAVTLGAVVSEGDLLARLHPDEDQSRAVDDVEEVDPDELRDDLAEIVERHRIGLDEARPEAVARRRRTGQRTARENVADLCDDDSFTEYGALVVAAQRRRRTLDDLIANTPADGMVTGIGRVAGRRTAVLAYDYTVLAGTQGLLNHRKTDRLLELAEEQEMPVVLFAEGGGGRPGDTDTSSASALDVPTFATMGRLSGRVPTVGIASGRCFAGNAALLGCCDVVIATRDATIGMGGPAMIEGGGLGVYRPEEVGPVSVQVPNGVVDVLVDDEAEAVDVARRYLSYFGGPASTWTAPDQRLLRRVVPENRVRAYDVRRAVELLADDDSVLELRPEFGVGVITALVRVEGRPMGLLANNPRHLGGAIDSPAADKAARFLQLCEAHGLPVLALVDTPGFMVGPDAERTATVRHFSRMFVTGAKLSVPVVAVVLRKGYGLGAMAMVGGGFRVPAATVAWPTGEVGGMGLEGAVRLGYRRELEAIADPEERQRTFDELLAEEYRRGKAVNAAMVFELDDVIDPADTRRWIVEALPPQPTGDRPRRRFVDTW